MITQAQYYINGINITPYLVADGVQESIIERRGREVITLTGVSRKWQINKRGLSLSFRKLRMETLQTLAPLLSGTVSVEYDDSVYGHTTRDFRASGLSDTVSKITGGNTWMTGIAVTLEEI